MFTFEKNSSITTFSNECLYNLFCLPLQLHLSQCWSVPLGGLQAEPEQLRFPADRTGFGTVTTGGQHSLTLSLSSSFATVCFMLSVCSHLLNSLISLTHPLFFILSYILISIFISLCTPFQFLVYKCWLATQMTSGPFGLVFCCSQLLEI